MVKLQAHKGVSAEYPENTMPAFIAAQAQCYSYIELDVSVTKDMQFVLLHDNTINRTARNGDGSVIDKLICIGDITYQEALEYDFGIWFSEEFKGVKIPLLENVLDFAVENSIKIKIDNKYLSFTDTEKEAFFKLIKPYEKVVGLTCNTFEAITDALKYFPEMKFHYDGPVNDDILQRLSDILSQEQLIVWLPFENKNTSWAKVPFADEILADKVKKYARLGIWLLSDYAELEAAEKLGAYVVETNGHLKP